jgi:hypothetical protein
MVSKKTYYCHPHHLDFLITESHCYKMEFGKYPDE